MGFLKRGLLSVVRKLGRTAILFVIFVAIANLVIAGFAIKNASQTASTLAREKIGGTLSLRFDIEKAMEESRLNQSTDGDKAFKMPSFTQDPITEEMVEEIAQLDHVVNYNISTSAFATKDESSIQPLSSSEDTDTGQEQKSNQIIIQGGAKAQGGGDAPTITLPDFSITGVSYSQYDTGFTADTGANTLTSGEHITPSDAASYSALIETSLAEANGINVGDKIKVKPQGSDESIELTVVGIYTAASTTTTRGGIDFNQPSNTIYTDYKTALEIKDKASSGEGSNMIMTGSTGIDSAVFYVDDPSNIDAVLEQAKSNTSIDFDKFVLDANNSAYEQLMKPIENVASFANILVIIVAIAGAAILALILMLWIKERVYETGVLLSIGESKGKVLLQYVSEVILVAIIAFTVSIFSGYFITEKVGDYLINNEITAVQQQSNSGPQTTIGPGGRTGGVISSAQNKDQMDSSEISDFYKDVKVTVDLKTILELYGIGLVVILAATIIPATSIMRYNPKTILTKAN